LFFAANKELIMNLFKNWNAKKNYSVKRNNQFYCQTKRQNIPVLMRSGRNKIPAIYY
jgi:hypothetical protein